MSAAIGRAVLSGVFALCIIGVARQHHEAYSALVDEAGPAVAESAEVATRKFDARIEQAPQEDSATEPENAAASAEQRSPVFLPDPAPGRRTHYSGLFTRRNTAHEGGPQTGPALVRLAHSNPDAFWTRHESRIRVLKASVHAKWRRKSKVMTAAIPTSAL